MIGRALTRLPGCWSALPSLVPASAVSATLTVKSTADALIPSDGECMREWADLIEIPTGTMS